jgi:hypothetical protein
VSHPGDARARLRSISLELHVFDLGLYPEEDGVRACANKLRKLLTRLKPTDRDLELYGHLYPDPDSPHSRMESTLRRVRNNTAAEILSVVYELHLKIQACQSL